jgi:hypothetical protein
LIAHSASVQGNQCSINAPFSTNGRGGGVVFMVCLRHGRPA